MNVGVIGYGYWGPNIVRNFAMVSDANVLYICDIKDESLKQAESTYPNITYTKEYREVTRSSDIDTVAIITPVDTHFELAKEALENGKHIFIEKPFTSTVEQAEKLLNTAEKKNLYIMVDHTFLFTGAVKKIKELIKDGILGEIYYFDSIRVNLGLFQHDINVIWDLAPHDFSVMDYILEQDPIALCAHGIDHFGRNLENIAYITVYLKNNIIAHFNVNWLSPVKVRSTLIGGSKKMIVWNDLEPDEKIKIYDKGVDIENTEGLYNLLISYRSGDMNCPKISKQEALSSEIEYFIHCISNNQRPFNDGYSGLKVLKLLEACDKSLKNGGKLINL